MLLASCVQVAALAAYCSYLLTPQLPALASNDNDAHIERVLTAALGGLASFFIVRIYANIVSDIVATVLMCFAVDRVVAARNLAAHAHFAPAAEPCAPPSSRPYSRDLDEEEGEAKDELDEEAARAHAGALAGARGSAAQRYAARSASSGSVLSTLY